MQITNTPNYTNFNGRFILKGDTKTYEMLHNKVLPLFHHVNPNKEVGVLNSDNMFKQFLELFVQKTADKTGYSKQWVVQNAEQHGIKINLNDRNDIFVFSGNDLSDVGNFFNKKTGHKEKLKNYVREIKNLFNPKAQYPEHLSEIQFLNKELQQAETDFYRFVQEKNCKKVNSINELLFELSKEK